MTRGTSARPIRFIWLLFLIAGTMGCSLVSNLYPEPAAQPEPSNSSGLIVYVGVDGNIYTVDQSGSHSTAITDDAGLETVTYLYPTWSPDAQRLSYLGIKQSSTGGQELTLYTADPGGKEATAVYQSAHESPFYFYWSPDSEMITFLSASDTSSGLSLWLTPSRGGEAQLLGIGQPFYWDWAPDSKSIFIHTGGSAQVNPDARLMLLERGESIRQTEVDLSPAYFQAPAWTPRGGELLVLAYTEDGSEALLLIDPSGSIKQTLHRATGPQAFAWSPDGALIGLSHTTSDIRGFLRGLTIIDPLAPEDKKIIVPDGVVAFFWSPDSRKIAYFQPESSTDQPGTQGISFAEQTVQLSLHIYDLDLEKSIQAALFTPSEEFLNIIPFFDQYQRSITFWSPDSTKLVISAQDESGNNGIFVVDAQGEQEIQQIAEGSIAFWSWR